MERLRDYLMSGGRRALNALSAVMLGAAVAVATLLWENEVRRRALAELTGHGSAELVAYLVARPDDCRSHHELLGIMERREVVGRIAAGGVILLGHGQGAARAIHWLRTEYPRLRAIRPGYQQRRLLREFGWHGPPRFIIVDRRRRALVLALDAPVSFDEQRAVRRAVVALAEREGMRQTVRPAGSTVARRRP